MLIGRRCGGTPVMSWPSMMSRPASGVSKPASRRSSVVLPQPEPPSSANSSPRSMTRSTLSTAVIAPKRLLTPSMRTMSPLTIALHARPHRPVLMVVHSRVRSRTCSAVPAVMV